MQLGVRRRGWLGDKLHTCRGGRGVSVKPAGLLAGLLVAFALGAWLPSSAQDNTQVARWYKGELHAHTINSDGDSPPVDVLAWYKRHGYNFLAITDHNTLTDPAPLDTNPADAFLLLGGEEVTNERFVHVNAIGVSHPIAPQKGATATEILQSTVDAIRGAGGLPVINHPNFGWALTPDDMLPVTGAALLEIASGQSSSNHQGDGLVPSTEQMWDELLSAGMRIYAVAVDDAHHFRAEFSIRGANPGRAWVVVKAPALTRDAILSALEDGEFYASTGVTLTEISATPESLSVTIAPEGMTYETLVMVAARNGRTVPPGASLMKRYRVTFIGESGRVLATSNENPAEYRITGDEGYVRARIDDSGGMQAWTQPVFIDSR